MDTFEMTGPDQNNTEAMGRENGLVQSRLRETAPLMLAGAVAAVTIAWLALLAWGLTALFNSVVG